MPHIDELLGAATLVSAGMFAALSLQPMGRSAAEMAAAHPNVNVSSAVAEAHDAALACRTVPTLPRRSGDAVGVQSKQQPVRDCAAKDARHPGA